MSLNVESGLEEMVHLQNIKSLMWPFYCSPFYCILLNSFQFSRLEEYDDCQAGELSNETKFVVAGREWPKKRMKFKNGLVLAERVSEREKIDKIPLVYLYEEKAGSSSSFLSPCGHMTQSRVSTTQISRDTLRHTDLSTVQFSVNGDNYF